MVIKYNLPIYKDSYINYGFILNYNFNKRLSIISGVEYSKREFSYYYDCRNCDWGSYKTITSNLIQTPLSLRFYPVKKKVKLFIQSGGLTSKSVTEFYERSLNFNWISSVGLDFNLYKKIRIEISGEYQYPITGIHTPSINLNAVFKRRFNKSTLQLPH